MNGNSLLFYTTIYSNYKVVSLLLLKEITIKSFLSFNNWIIDLMKLSFYELKMEWIWIYKQISLIKSNSKNNTQIVRLLLEINTNKSFNNKTDFQIDKIYQIQ